MSDMPSFEDAAAKLSELPIEYTLHSGKAFVSWQTLAYALFEKGSPHWQRPAVKVYGRSISPAVDFMDRFRFSGLVETINVGAKTYYRLVT